MSRPWRVPAAVAAIITGLAIEDRLGTALGAMHRAGDVSASFDSVASPTALWSAPATREMVRAWRDWNADRLAAGLGGRFIGPTAALVGYALVDALLVVLPVAALLGLAARSATRRISAHPNPDPTVDAALRRVAELSGLAVLAYLGLGLLVDVGTPLVVYFSATALLPWLGLLTLLTWVALGWSILPLGFADLVALRRMILRQTPGWLSERLRVWSGYLLALRAQLVAAALIAVLVTVLRGDIGLQIDDVAMRWLEYWPAGVLAAVVAGFASWLILLSGEVCWYRHWQERLPAPDPGSRNRLLLMGLLGLVVAAAGLVIVELAHLSFGAVLVWPGAALLLFSALSLPEKILAVRPRPTPAGPPPTGAPATTGEPGSLVEPGTAAAAKGPAVLLWIAGAVPLGALGVIAARAATTLFVTQELRALWLVAVGLGALTLATLMVISRVPSLPARLEARTVLWFASGVTVAAALVAAVWPIAVGQKVGAIALLFLIAAVLTVVVSALSLLGEAWTPSGALALLGLRRMPVITLVVVWFAVTSVVDQTDHYHDVRLAGPRPAGATTVTADTALRAWLEQHRPSEPPEPGPTPTRQTVPLVFVSASGGGIRAAYWTAMVLDCLFDAHPTQRECASDRPLDRSDVFVESGISGGSVGFAFDRVLAGSDRGWADALGGDFVSPDVAALGFRDIPNSFLRWEPSGMDRAAVLEKAWEQAAGGDRLRTGLFADSRKPDGRLRFPLLMLSGATVDDACQLNTSVLRAAPRPAQGPQPPLGTADCLSLTPFEPGRAHDPGSPDGSALAASKDLADFTCAPGSGAPRDVALSTAALLSARFPYISPTGGLSGCDDPQRRTFDIDGGLIDSSGLSAITDLWAHLAGDVQAINDNPANPICVEPRLLMIDNGYLPAAAVAAPSQPQELLAPIQGRSRVTSQRSAQDEQEAALAFDHAFGAATCAGVSNLPATPASRVAHLVPTSQPGTQAPLGWTLSRFARDDLEEQLNSPANRCEIQLVRSWFRSDPNAQTGFCVTGFAVRHAGSPQTGPLTLSTLPVTTSDDVGVAGVRLTADGCVQAPLTACSVTTDAAGRFDLLLIPGQQQTLHVDYGGVRRTGVPVPVSPGFVNTTINVLVSGAPG